MGPSVFSVVSSISGGCSGRDVATIVYITACSGDVQSGAQRVDLITSVLGRAHTSVLNLAAVCYRTVQPMGRFNLLWFLRPAASVLNHSAVCYPQDCSAQESLPCAVVAVSSFMGIMACRAGRRLA
jgi:hypothetical protein